MMDSSRYRAPASLDKLASTAVQHTGRIFDLACWGSVSVAKTFCRTDMSGLPSSDLTQRRNSLVY